MRQTPFCSATPYSPHFGTPALKLQKHRIPPGPSRLCNYSRKSEKRYYDLDQNAFVTVKSQRIVFKLTTMVYKCQHSLCSSHLAEDCIPLPSACSRQHLQSAAGWRCLFQRLDLWHLDLALLRWQARKFGNLCFWPYKNRFSCLTVSGDLNTFCSFSCNWLLRCAFCIYCVCCRCKCPDK